MSKGRHKARGKGTEDQLDRKIRGERKRQSETKADRHTRQCALSFLDEEEL